MNERKAWTVDRVQGEIAIVLANPTPESGNPVVIGWVDDELPSDAGDPAANAQLMAKAPMLQKENEKLRAENADMAKRLFELEEIHRDDDGCLVWLSSGNYVGESDGMDDIESLAHQIVGLVDCLVNDHDFWWSTKWDALVSAAEEQGPRVEKAWNEFTDWFAVEEYEES